MLLQLTKQFRKKEYTKEIWFSSECSIALPFSTRGLNYFVQKRWSSLVSTIVPPVLSAEHYKMKMIISFLFGTRTVNYQRKKSKILQKVLSTHLKVAEELLTTSYLATTWANFYFSSQAIRNGLSLWFQVKYAAKIAVLDYRLSSTFKPSFMHSPLQQKRQLSDQAHKHYCRTLVSFPAT